MATFVDICPGEEQVTSLIQYVDSLKKKMNPAVELVLAAECTQLLQEDKTVEVITKLITEHEAIFHDTNDKDIEACINVLSATIKKLAPDVAATLIQKLRDAVVANVADRPILRLRILTNIYYAFDRTSASRYDIFIAMATFAAESGNAELVIPKFKQMDQWLVDWGATIDQTRRLYKLARKILANNNRSLQAHELITKYLQTFNADIKVGKSVEEEVVATAAEAAREAISSDDIYQCDHLCSLEAVKLLEHHAQYSLLYQLLQIFAQEKLDSFQEFQTKHPKCLEGFGLTEARCLHKIRLLSLASLGAENSEIPYGLVAQTLQISEDEVESWVIDAVSVKLVEAKINQLKRVVIVSFCVQRVFSIAQWKQLSLKLNKWKGSVRHLLQTVQQTRRGPAAQTTQPPLTAA